MNIFITLDVTIIVTYVYNVYCQFIQSAPV